MAPVAPEPRTVFRPPRSSKATGDRKVETTFPPRTLCGHRFFRNLRVRLRFRAFPCAPSHCNRPCFSDKPLKSLGVSSLWHSGGQGFDSPRLHHLFQYVKTFAAGTRQICVAWRTFFRELGKFLKMGGCRERPSRLAPSSPSKCAEPAARAAPAPIIGRHRQASWACRNPILPFEPERPLAWRSGPHPGARAPIIVQPMGEYNSL